MAPSFPDVTPVQTGVHYRSTALPYIPTRSRQARCLFHGSLDAFFSATYDALSPHDEAQKLIDGVQILTVESPDLIDAARRLNGELSELNDEANGLKRELLGPNDAANDLTVELSELKVEANELKRELPEPNHAVPCIQAWVAWT